MCSTKSSRLQKKHGRYLQTLDECARHTTESIQAWRGQQGHVGGELEGKSPTFGGPKVTTYKGPHHSTYNTSFKLPMKQGHL